MNNFVGHIEQRATALQAQLQQLETQMGLVTTQDARTVDDKALGNPWRFKGFFRTRFFRSISATACFSGSFS